MNPVTLLETALGFVKRLNIEFNYENLLIDIDNKGPHRLRSKRPFPKLMKKCT